MPGWSVIKGNLVTPKGFRAAAVASGIKKTGALDLALIVADAPQTSAAGVFTTNLAAAAPVGVSRTNLKKSRGRARAIIVNSGNANACTGAEGRKTAERTVRAVAEQLDVPTQQVLVASTGIIGVPLRVDLILKQVPGLYQNLSEENATAVERAIMTTDGFPKSAVLKTEIGRKDVHLAGVAKGAGMIHPRMATMLSFITTDVAIEPGVLHKLLKTAADESFNRISVDGDRSTNDTVIVLASGVSDVAVRPATPAHKRFESGLIELCQTLAKKMVQDGEGATKVAKVVVSGARGAAEADCVARSIANSPLVKSALTGSDPNWGRIVCAAGYSGVKIDPTKVDVRVNGMFLCRRGVRADFDEATARRELDQKEVALRVDLHQGKAESWIWTCDFTEEYIRINAGRS